MRPREQTGGALDPASGTALKAAQARGLLRFGAPAAHGWFARREDTVARVEVPHQHPALVRAELVLSNGKRSIGKRRMRIPTDAIVGIGRKSPEDTRESTRLVRNAPIANDNQRRLSPKLRTFLREIFVMLLFGATLAGTYYVGRLHAFQNVISVPDTPTRGHRIV